MRPTSNACRTTTAVRERQRRLVLITHPQVVISADVPVPRWPLSERGRERTRAGLRQAWVADLSAVYCSDEQKAIDGDDPPGTA